MGEPPAFPSASSCELLAAVPQNWRVQRLWGRRATGEKTASVPLLALETVSGAADETLSGALGTLRIAPKP